MAGKKLNLNRLYFIIAFITVSTLLIYFSTDASLDLLKANEKSNEKQEEIELIQSKTENFINYIKDGKYQDAVREMEYVKNNNSEGKYDEYLNQMYKSVDNDFDLVNEALYNDTINDSIQKRINGLKLFIDRITLKLEEEIDVNYKSYVDLKAEYNLTRNYLKNAKLFGLFEDKIQQYILSVDNLNKTRSFYQKGVTYMDRSMYEDAIIYFKKVPESDIQFYADAQKKIEECNINILDSYMAKAQPFIDNQRYQEALTVLYKAKNLFPNNSELLDKIDFCTGKLENLAVYNGPIYHIFFHSLIVYPELAFDGDNMASGYNDYMVTADEFKKILQQLYENNYVLYNINSLYQTVEQDGKTIVKRRTVYVPKGKKPLILSIDDVSYYEYMKTDGFASKLIIDNNGKVANEVKTPNGDTITSYEADIMPMVDSFVEKHPDFSFQGAKGILALTGYEGVLGYRTNNIEADNFEEVRTQAMRVAKALKTNGWLFASHSYSHNEDFSDGKFDLSLLKYDTERWKREVEPIVGKTDLYITPFGYQIAPGSDKYEYLTSQGYTSISAVGGKPYIKYTNKAIMMDRQNIDGLRMFHNPKMLAPLFNVNEVIDKTRPYSFEDKE